MCGGLAVRGSASLRGMKTKPAPQRAFLFDGLRRTERELNRDPFCRWSFNDQVSLEVWWGWMYVAHATGATELGPSEGSLVPLPSDLPKSPWNGLPRPPHPLPSTCLGWFNSCTKAGRCSRCPPATHQASKPPRFLRKPSPARPLWH